MITTIGVSYILFNIILLSVGAEARNYPNPMPAVRFHINGAVLDIRVLLIWGVALVLMAGLYLFVQKSRHGQGDARHGAGPRGGAHDGRGGG